MTLQSSSSEKFLADELPPQAYFRPVAVVHFLLLLSAHHDLLCEHGSLPSHGRFAIDLNFQPAARHSSIATRPPCSSENGDTFFSSIMPRKLKGALRPPSVLPKTCINKCPHLRSFFLLRPPLPRNPISLEAVIKLSSWTYPSHRAVSHISDLASFRFYSSSHPDTMNTHGDGLRLRRRGYQHYRSSVLISTLTVEDSASLHAPASDHPHA